MRAVSLKHLKDLARIAEGFNIMGGIDTDDLYTSVDKYPVKRDNGDVVGYIVWDEEIEEHVFRPVHTRTLKYR